MVFTSTRQGTAENILCFEISTGCNLFSQPHKLHTINLMSTGKAKRGEATETSRKQAR